VGVPLDAPEVILAAAEVAEATPGPTPGTPARPPGPAVPGVNDPEAAGEGPPDGRQRGRRARNLLRFTAPRRPEEREVEAADPEGPSTSG
jgi:hypothetical protein